MSAFGNWIYKKNETLFHRLLETRSLIFLPWSKYSVHLYLKNSSEPKLQLGSGRNFLPGWLNTDYLAKPPKFPYLNASRPFPFPDDRFVRIFSEHMIEHIDQKSGENMLRECFRVLKPSCRIRIETPDLEKFCGLYSRKEGTDADAYVKWHTQNYALPGYPGNACFAINNALRNWGHRFIYDEEMLRFVMEKTGFINLKRYEWNVSDDEKFANISLRGGYPFSQFETIAMEAEKPPA